jgi:hypothetical protein
MFDPWGKSNSDENNLQLFFFRKRQRDKPVLFIGQKAHAQWNATRI